MFWEEIKAGEFVSEDDNFSNAKIFENQNYNDFY